MEDAFLLLMKIEPVTIVMINKLGTAHPNTLGASSPLLGTKSPDHHRPPKTT